MHQWHGHLNTWLSEYAPDKHWLTSKKSLEFLFNESILKTSTEWSFRFLFFLRILKTYSRSKSTKSFKSLFYKSTIKTSTIALVAINLIRVVKWDLLSICCHITADRFWSINASKGQLTPECSHSRQGQNNHKLTPLLILFIQFLFK